MPNSWCSSDRAAPTRIERPFPTSPRWLTLRTSSSDGVTVICSLACGAAVVEPERPVDQQHVEPEEAEHRPGARQQKHHAGDKADAAEHRHEHHKAGPAQRAVRRQHRRKQFRLRIRIVACGHRRQYTRIMAKIIRGLQAKSKLPAAETGQESGSQAGAARVRRAGQQDAERQYRNSKQNRSKPKPWTPAEVV